MSEATPTWLTQRGGSLRLGADNRTWFVFLGEQPNYSLKPLPVAGKFGCAIKQTINGRLVPSTSTFATADEALHGGLGELGKELGWV